MNALWDSFLISFSDSFSDLFLEESKHFQLPKGQAIEATEHVFKVSGKNESSQYIPMENEDQAELNRYNKSQTESLISYTASDVTSMINTSSCHTATVRLKFKTVNIKDFFFSWALLMDTLLLLLCSLPIRSMKGWMLSVQSPNLSHLIMQCQTSIEVKEKRLIKYEFDLW